MNITVRILEVDASVNLTTGDDPTGGYCDPTMNPYSGGSVLDNNLTTHKVRPVVVSVSPQSNALAFD